MYVIFPLDELLDLNSARENKRGRATLYKQSHTRNSEEVLPLSQPNQLLPNQLNPSLLNKQPQTSLQQPTPSSIKQQKNTTSTPPQKPPTPSRKPSLSKFPSKTSITVTPPSIVVPSQSQPSPPPVSVTNATQNASVKKQQQQQQQQPPQQTVSSTGTPAAQLPPDQGNARQRSSHSTSTETSSTSSSTGAKGKALLSPQASTASNRASWGGGPTAGPFQESCPARRGSFKAFKDLTVSTEGNSLKIVEPTRSESAQDIAGSTLSVRPPLKKNNSFRSHLSDSCALRPRQTGVEPIRKNQGSSTPIKQPSPSAETLKKGPVESLEVIPPSQRSKTPEAAVTKPGTPVQTAVSVGSEGVKVKQEVPVKSTPPAHVPQQQLTAAESLRIQQDCLSQVSDTKAVPLSPSGRSSNRTSGSQRLPDQQTLSSSSSTSGVGTRGTTTGSKAQGGLGSPRSLQQQQQQQELLQQNSVMASNEPSLRDLTNPSHNESLKAHNAFTFKLVKTGPSSGELDESHSPDGISDHLNAA